jgi:hypothetical protein
MHTIAVGEMIRFGWETYKKRPLFFIGTVILVVLLSGILSAFTPEEIQNPFHFFLAAVFLIVNVVIEMGLVAFALKAHDSVDHVQIKDLWRPQSFWKYVAAKILTGIIAAGPMVILAAALGLDGPLWLGTTLFILFIPATIWAVIAGLSLMFATYLVVDRDLGPVVAVKESVRIVTGHRWQLFLLVCALILINILGAIALLVGLLVSIPVSLLVIAHAYRKLAGKAA